MFTQEDRKGNFTCLEVTLKSINKRENRKETPEHLSLITYDKCLKIIYWPFRYAVKYRFPMTPLNACTKFQIDF